MHPLFRREGYFLAFLGAAAACMCLILGAVYYQFRPFDADSVSYLFQAKLFAQGKLWAEAPPSFGFSPSPHINILDGKWFSKYPFGNALMLAPGVWLGMPFLIPALLTGLTLVLLYRLLKEIWGRKIAATGALIGLISPATAGIGATYLSEATSRFFLVLFMWGLVRMLKTKRLGYAVLAGFALGYALNTRIVTSLAFGLVGGIVTLAVLARSADRRAFVRPLAVCLAVFGLMLGVLLAWNKTMTGEALRFTQTAQQPYDGMGFGLRGEGIAPTREGLFDFTPSYAAKRLVRHILPDIAYHALGWSQYHPMMFTSNRNFANSASAGLIIKGSDGQWEAVRLWRKDQDTALLQPVDQSVDSAIWLYRDEPWMEPDPVALPIRDSQAEISLSLRLHRGTLAAAFQESPAERFLPLKPLRTELKPPYEIGFFADPGSYGSIRASFAGITLNGVPADTASWESSGAFATLHLQPDSLTMEPARTLFAKGPGRSAGLHQAGGDDDAHLQAQLHVRWGGDPWLWPKALLLYVPLLLLFVPVLFSPYRREAWVFLGLLAANLGAYFFHYFDGSVFGYTTIGVSYYAEVILLAVVPLLACAFTLLYERFIRNHVWRRKAALILLIALGANTLYTYFSFIPPNRAWNPPYQALPRLVEEAGLKHAVVFVIGREAPLGEYPFKPLEEADVVYFRFGSLPEWKVNYPKWQEPYARYFSGRTPYVYYRGTLRQPQ